VRFDLAGRRVLITGAASGIGLACAEAFAAKGARLILSDIDGNALARVAGRLGAIVARPCDISSEAEVMAFATEVKLAAGGIDVLINNAGIGYLGAFEDTSPAAWRRVFDINVMGMVLMIRAFLPGMRSADTRAAIVNIASTAGFAPAACMAAYAASKHAVVGLSEVLAMELDGTPIGVTIVAPGIVNTNIVKARGNIAPQIGEDQIARLQAYYDARGCGAEVIARDIVRGVERGASMIRSGPYAALLCGMMRVSRRLTRRLSIASSQQIGFLGPRRAAG